MTRPHSHTAAELLAILSARQLSDGQVVFAGIGIPLLAATLAQRLRCPGLTILFEGGVIGAFVEPGKLPPSTNDQRCTKRANMVLGSAEVLLLLQRGYVDVGFMGGAQIDQYGNLNSSFIGDPAKPKTRLPGTGGGNDIASLAQMIVAMKHEKRRFVEHVDFITSPGYLRGGDTRRASGLADRRHVPRGHRSRGVRLRREDEAHEGAVAQSRREPRAGAGQHRVRPRFRRPPGRDRAADRSGAAKCCASSIPNSSSPRSSPSHTHATCNTNARLRSLRWLVCPGRSASRCRTSPPIRRCRTPRRWSTTACRMEQLGFDSLWVVGSHPARRRAELSDHRIR